VSEQIPLQRALRVGLCPLPSEPFWLQVEQAIYRRAQQLPLQLVPIYRDEANPELFPPEGSGRVEALLALDLDALIGWIWPDELAYPLLESGLPIIHLHETSIRHPLSVSPGGLHDAAQMLAAYLAERMGGEGEILVVGGLVQSGLGDNGASRIDGIQAALVAHPKINLRHIHSAWNGEKALQQVRAAMQQLTRPIKAILGLSDELALLARDVARSLSLLEQNTLVAGINADPLALAAIAKGELTATVALFPEEFGECVLDATYQVARKGTLTRQFEHKFRLVTMSNVTEVMADTLTTLSNLPGWLAQVNQHRQQQRLNQLEASLEIISRMQSRFDSYRQLREIVELICAEHGYDRAKIYRWVEQENRLLLIDPSNPSSLDLWYDLDGDSWREILQQLPGQPGPDNDARLPMDRHDPGSVIIADGLGRIGDWYDLTGASSNSVVDQIASWMTAESKAFAQAFEARYGLKPSPSAAGLSYDYANMWIQIARQVYRDTGELNSKTLADFIWNKLLTGEWSYTSGCIMREYKFTPDTAPDPVVSPQHFTFPVLEYLDGEGTVIFPSGPGDHEQVPDRAPAQAEPMPAGEATRSFKLGIMGPFSGFNAVVGIQMKGAVEMAFDQINHRIGPYQIDLEWIDCQSDPAKASLTYEEAILQHGIQACLLNWHTPVALACMKVAARYKIPHFFSLAGASAINAIWRSDPKQYFYWVKGWPEPAKLTANYVQALEDAIARDWWQPEAKTAAFWGEDTEWGRSFAAGMKEQLEGAGWKIVAEDYFPVDQTDFVPWLMRIRERKPALLAGTASNPVTYSSFVKQAHKLGLERMFTWATASQPSISMEESDLLVRALSRNEPVYIPYMDQNLQTARDAALTETRARLILPVRHSQKIMGLLDLRSQRATWHTRLELVSLQVLADQLGHAMWDAQNFGRVARARVIAEKSDQSKTRLLANVSHELRTPLNVILGYTQHTLDSLKPHHADLPAVLVNDIQHIHRTSEHLLHMTNDLLDLSRAEIHELELALKIIDPGPLLADVFHSLADSAKQHATRWMLELPERLPMIKADPIRLRQILFNLLSNAQRFTDRGEITLGAEVAPPQLHIWVQDTGLGILPEFQEQIFKPFVTAQHTDRSREGVGLGLSIVRQLVALHDGSISLESQPGQGSTFHVYLPLPSLADEPQPLPVTAKRVLLLISNEEQPPAEVVSFCQRQGLEIRSLHITDPLDKLFEEVQPAALAWDLACANASQWSLVERLRGYPGINHIPFLVYGPGQLQRDEAPLGLTSFVLKPVHAKSLLEALETMRPIAIEGPVLIVDDDPQTREYLASLLTEDCSSYTIRMAADGADAIRHMTQEIPSLVILDLVMPGVDGFKVLEWMHSNMQTSRVPVLVLTGHPLSLEDVKKLERHTLVTVHSKEVLSDTEIVSAVNRSLFGTDTLSPCTSGLVMRAVAYFHLHYAEPLTRKDVAQAIGVSENYFSQIFRRELGISPWEYLTRYRIKQAERLLRFTTENITHIAKSVGFEDPAYFGRVFRKETGVSPTVFRTS
jgi:signal transduction histidine kinase/AraC-like DNA-binding protein/DNA-binding LacI/PurR family transcriptional regulator